MIIDLNITLILTLSGIAIGTIYAIYKLGNDIFHWFTKTTVKDVKIEDLPSDSSLKKAFDDFSDKLNKQEQYLKSLRSYAQDNRAFQLRTEIRFAIEHDLGKNEVRRLYEIYKSIPTNKSARNGHISAEIKEYIEKVNKKRI